MKDAVKFLKDHVEREIDVDPIVMLRECFGINAKSKTVITWGYEEIDTSTLKPGDRVRWVGMHDATVIRLWTTEERLGNIWIIKCDDSRIEEEIVAFEAALEHI